MRNPKSCILQRRIVIVGLSIIQNWYKQHSVVAPSDTANVLEILSMLLKENLHYANLKLFLSDILVL